MTRQGKCLAFHRQDEDWVKTMATVIWDYINQYEWMNRIDSETFPPLMISCAITPEFRGKESNLNIPETVKEQIEAAWEAYQEGACIVHIHARDPEDLTKAAADKEIFSEINSEIKRRCPDIIISNSTRGSLGYRPEQKLCCLNAQCKPDLVNLNTGIMQLDLCLEERKPPLPDPKPKEQVDVNILTTYKEVHEIAQAIKACGIKPEIEINQPGQFWVMKDLMKTEDITPPYLCRLTLGYQSSSYASPQKFINTLRELPKDSIFFGTGTAKFQLPMNVLAILYGGHVRVGMEDTLLYQGNEPVKSNAQLVARVSRIAGELNRTIATPVKAREMLGLDQRSISDD